MNRWVVGLVMLGLAVTGVLVFVLKVPPQSVPSARNPPVTSSPVSNLAAPSSAQAKPASTPAAPIIALAEQRPPATAPASAPHKEASGDSTTATTATGGPSAPDPDPSGLPPATVLENTRSVFRNFASRFGGNPVGTNPEITAALNGGNPKQVNFLNAEDGLRINARGELIDSWGTPYFFHQLSAKEMEIHSAGPDRIMWTPDDLVIK